MMVDTRVYGYITQDGAFCPGCVGPEDDATANRLYSTDDNDVYGLTCDACCGYIFEPDYQGAWVDAIQDIITYGRANGDGDWRTAERILLLFEDADFETAGRLPER